MSESKHSPGPWHQDGHNLSSVIRCIVPRGHPDARHTCGDYETIARCDSHNWAANARLIAAAPDLLDACKRASAILRGDGAPGWGIAKDILNTAIAKAEGRS